MAILTASSNPSYTTSHMDQIKTDNISASKVANTFQDKYDAVVKPLVGDRPSLQVLKIDWTKKTIGILLAIIAFGLLSGFLLYAQKTAGVVRLVGRDVQIVKTSNEEGVKDASTFRDTATGTLQENDGKITKEGTHVLIRGDVSQNAYLTSSVIDLSKYIGKKVQVWGETFKGQKAGWLMDVGRIKIVP